MPIYLNYGEEVFLVEYNTRKKIDEYNLANPSMNLIYLNDDSIDRLVQNCEQLPFFDENKVIVAKNTGIFTGGNKKISADKVEEILEYIQKLPDYVILIFSEESVDKRLTAYKKIAKIASCTEYKYNNIVDLSNWITKGIKTLGGKIEFEVAQYLAESCGPSMTYLYTEIQKLATLNKEGREINKSLINSVCMKSEQGIIFDLTDAIGNRDAKKALTLINDFVLQKQPEQYLIVMIYKHVRNLYAIKVAQREGRASAENLGMNPYVYKKAIPQANKFTEKELKNVLDKIIELDEKSKTGEMNIRVGMDTIVALI